VVELSLIVMLGIQAFQLDSRVGRGETPVGTTPVRVVLVGQQQNARSA
jgi:hypothetical protein